MYVEMDLRGAEPVVRLREPSDFTALKLVVVGPMTGLNEALAPLGRRSGAEHAFLAPRAIRALAGTLVEDAPWCKSFDEMMGYAIAKGWTDETGNVRAHIEREPSLSD